MAPDRARNGRLIKPRGGIVIILDTSAFLYPFQTGVDFVKGIRENLAVPVLLAVTSGTINEIERIRRGRSASLSIASAKALEYAKTLTVLKSDLGRTDEQIVQLASDLGAAVATADSALRRKLRSKGIPVVFVSKGKRIRMEGNFGRGTVV